MTFTQIAIGVGLVVFGIALALVGGFDRRRRDMDEHQGDWAE